YMTYARFFIPKFVEEDKVLYLDSDLVVTRSLDGLFAKDIEDYYLAAAKIGYGLEERFNAGVLLINNRRWKDEQIMEHLLEVVSQEHQNLTEADQSVLNMVIKDRYLLL
ncbi:glycosyltransferase, partial [Streptococcus suis]